MVIEVSEGCTAFWMEVNGVEHEFISDALWVEFLQTLAKDSSIDRDNFIRDFCKDYGEIEYESDEPCESCGDYVTRWKYGTDEEK